MSPAARRRLWIALQVAFVGAAFWYVGKALTRQWTDVRQSLSALQPSWPPILLSGVLVFAAYALLIQTWRVMLASWGIAALSVLAQQEGVSPVAATGSALIVNLANILSGFVFVLAGGLRLLDATTGGRSGLAIAIAAVLLLGLLLLPALLPRVAALAGRLTRSWGGGERVFDLPRIPVRAIWIATLGTAAAWLLYGTAFALLARGVLPGSHGSLADAVAVYTISYLAGYLFVPAPGGLGVREWTLVLGMTTLGLAAQGDAWVIAFASRLWLTVLEVLPGALFVLIGGIRRPPANLRRDHV